MLLCLHKNCIEAILCWIFFMLQTSIHSQQIKCEADKCLFIYGVGWNPLMYNKTKAVAILKGKNKTNSH